MQNKNMLAIVLINSILDSEATNKMRTDIENQMDNGILIKDNTISKIILIDKLSGQVIVEL